MSEQIVAPTSVEETVEAVAEAVAAKTSFEIRGGGTRGLGRSVKADKILSTAKLTGITFYDPKELSISAAAGTPFADIEAALAENGQMLPFEPMDHRHLSGLTGTPTIGAIAAANISGPRRVTSGAARDFLIGLKLVNGRAEQIKSGGRAMKNVTGLDLVKLMSGAHGTLGVLTDVTFKVLPAPQYASSLVIAGLSDTDAVQVMGAALGSPYGVSGAVHVPAVSLNVARTLLRIEGFEDSVNYRVKQVTELIAQYGNAEIISGADNVTLWRDIGDAKPLSTLGQNIWRVSVAASKAVSLMEMLDPEHQLEHFYDWGGGLIWLATPETDFDICARVQLAAAEFGGHATLVHASDDFREQVDVFQPLSAPVMTLTRGVKHSFDPHNIFNPSRMYRGI